MQCFQQQGHQGAPLPWPDCVSAQLNEMPYAELGSQQFGQMLHAASIDALPRQQQQQQQLLQPYPTATLQRPECMERLSPQLNMMTCTDSGSEEFDQLLEAIVAGALPSQEQQQQASQQLQLYPSVPQTQQLMEAPVWNACAPPLLHPVVSANTPDQFLSALDAFLGSALQYSTGQQDAVPSTPSTDSAPLTQQQLQQQPSSSAPSSAASPSCLSSGCTSSATQQRSPWAVGSSTAEAAGNAVTAGWTIHDSAAAAAAAVPSAGHSDWARGVISVQPPATTRQVVFKRVRRPTPLTLRKQQQQEYMKTVSETAPSALLSPSGQATPAGSSVPVDAPGSSRGLVLCSDSLTWQQQLRSTQSGCKRRLDTFKSPFASCCQNSGGSSSMGDHSFAAQQQEGRQRHGWQQRTGSGSMMYAAEDCNEPPSPTTAAAAAAKAALQTAASSNLAGRSSGATARSTLTWQQAQPAAAAAAVSQGWQCGSSQPGASNSLRMSLQLMHYADPY